MARQQRKSSRLIFLGAKIERGQLQRLDALAQRDRRSRSSMLRVLLDISLAAHAASQRATA